MDGTMTSPYRLARRISARLSAPCPEPVAVTRAPWWREAEFWVLGLLVLLMYVPGLDRMTVRNEETRRGRIAWEILDRQDWIIPRLQGDPWLSRPPLHYWAVAVVGQWRGTIDAWAVRLPSAAAILLSCGLIYLYARTNLSRSASFLAGLAFATMGQVLQLGHLGETDAFFASLVSASFLIWHRQFLLGRSAWLVWIPAYVCVALATLAKGLQPSVYFAAAIGAYLLFTRQWRYALSLGHLAGLLAGSGMVLLWLIPFYGELGWEGVHDIFFHQVAERFQVTWKQTLQHLLLFPFEWLAGSCLPWSLLLIAFANPQFRATLGRSRPQLQFLLCCLLVTLPSVWFTPGARTRYFLPLFPCVAVLVGITVERLWDTARPNHYQLVWRYFVRGHLLAVGILGLIVLGAGFWPKPTLLTLSAPAVAMMVAVSAATVWLLELSLRRPEQVSPRAAAWILAGFIGYSYHAVYIPAVSFRAEDVAASVQSLKQQLPPGTKLQCYHHIDHNFSYHWGERLQIEPWPQSVVTAAGEPIYCCLNPVNMTSPEVPITWEQVAAISCERLHKEHPARWVIVAKVTGILEQPKHAPSRRTARTARTPAGEAGPSPREPGRAEPGRAEMRHTERWGPERLGSGTTGQQR